MKNKYINIYNNLVNLTRNKDLYKNFTTKDSFSDRLILFLLHFAFFLKVYKKNDKKIIQEIYDYIFVQLEVSIREIGYGDVSINKNMKIYINLFHSMLIKVEKWDTLNQDNKSEVIQSLLNLKNKQCDLSIYFDKYKVQLEKNTLNFYIKSVISH
tara:strand:+ start:791 stop:1255 length:465 start_codon:yes stop_codon:yes gene_type:complete